MTVSFFGMRVWVSEWESGSEGVVGVVYMYIICIYMMYDIYLGIYKVRKES